VGNVRSFGPGVRPPAGRSSSVSDRRSPPTEFDFQRHEILPVVGADAARPVAGQAVDRGTNHNRPQRRTVRRFLTTVAAILGFVTGGGIAVVVLSAQAMGLAAAMLLVGGPVGIVSDTVVGVDINERNVALTALDRETMRTKGTLVLDYGQVKHERQRYHTITTRCQEHDEKSIHRRLGDKEERFTDTTGGTCNPPRISTEPPRIFVSTLAR
jgi:hypothetical protein